MFNPKSFYFIVGLLMMGLSLLSGCNLTGLKSSKMTDGGQGSELHLISSKPTLAQVHASWCPACQNIKPTWERLKLEYKGKVNFVILDVSSSKKLQKSTVIAHQLGLEQWFLENQSKTSTIILLLPPAYKGQILSTFVNEPDENSYRKVLKPLLEK